MKTESKNTTTKKLPVAIVICSTLVMLAAISGWVYIHQQNIAQKDRELSQQKELKEYEQQQLNERNKADNDTELRKIRTNLVDPNR